MPPRRIASLAGLLIGLAALVLQFSLTIPLLLAGLWAPEAWFKVADVTLHYVTPSLYIIWWLVFQPHGTLQFRDVPLMLAPPLIYLVYAMIRGAIVAEYPYPILEAHKLGYPQVALNILFVLIGLAVLGAIAVGIDRLLGRGKATAIP